MPLQQPSLEATKCKGTSSAKADDDDNTEKFPEDEVCWVQQNFGALHEKNSSRIALAVVFAVAEIIKFVM
jgi:hypothetical protein